MDEALRHLFSQLHWTLLCVAIAGTLAVLGKAADWLVDEAVALSERSGLPKSIIGATIVSLGTTTPEAAVSVLAARHGNPGLALGNAVGSVICDSGLVLGLISIMAPLVLDRRIVNRQGWIQIAAALGLVVLSIPWKEPRNAFYTGGHFPQWAGFLLLLALVLYLWRSTRWIRSDWVSEDALVEEHERDVRAPVTLIFLKISGGLALLIASADVLIPAVTEAALRLHVPDSVIAATVVAFGTSLPELVTAIAAARRGHGELALGTVIGADILNVLFVAGSAAAASPGGLLVDAHFFRLLYPVLVFILVIFRIGIWASRESLKKPFGMVMLGAYVFYALITYMIPGGSGL